ncbi:MAG: alpha/beta hydrolase domain-containing protein, partial [Sphingopyxis sp.]
NLDRWVTTGQAPPRAERLRVAPDGRDYARDAFGNPLGGVRVAQLDVPLVRYAEPPAALCGGNVPRRNLHQLPVDPALIAARYPRGAISYRAQFNAALDQLVRDHWLVPQDAAQQRRTARAAEQAAFPRPAR